MITGKILNIQRFCTQDGPGIRTTVFLKGCPLSCLWCSNPESQSMGTEYALAPLQCKRCGTCYSVCPERAVIKKKNGDYMIDRSRCHGCGRCFSECPFQAVRRFGYEADADEVFGEVLSDLPYYQHSGGGLTVSGGEPALQWEFTRELLRRAKKHKIGTLVETAGGTSWESLSAVLEYTDIVYFDLKAASPKLHKSFTGVDNHLILENLRLASESSERLVVRVPLIPGVNDAAEELMHIAEIIRSLPRVERIGVLPYHKFGENKYALLNRKYEMEHINVPSEEQVSHVCSVLAELTGKKVCKKM